MFTIAKIDVYKLSQNRVFGIYVMKLCTVGNLSGRGDQEPRLPGEAHSVAWSTRPDKGMGQIRARGPGRTRLRRPDSPGFAGLK
jgi:hypothetical protein